MFSHFKHLSSKFSLSHKPLRSFSLSKDFIIPNRERATIYAENSNGMLSRILGVFHHNNIRTTDVSTKPLNIDKEGKQQIIFDIDFEGTLDSPRVIQLLKELEAFSAVKVDYSCPEVPWFPSSFADLDHMGNMLQNPDEDAGKDHPGFNDNNYRLRRDEIAQSSLGYKMGNPIPKLKYRPEENKTWEHIYKILRPLQEKYMCDSFNKSFEKMSQAGILKPTEIPQLEDINEFLIKETNWRLKPVTGILSQREFLNSLAMRTFCCTQYIRHHSKPEYTPEPDIIHEILGHVAMFSDPAFCDLSQQIGLLSLGSPTENLEKLGALYWYTIEFGVCKEGNDIKGYGAGVASSIGEIKNMGEKKAEFRPLNPFVELNTNFPIQSLQPVYYVADSFESAGDMLIRFGERLPKPFKAYYNNKNNRVEVDKKIKLIKVDEKPVDF